MKIEERIAQTKVTRRRTMTPHGESKTLFDYTIDGHEYRSVLLEIQYEDYYDKDSVRVLQVYEGDLVHINGFDIDNCHPDKGLFDYLVGRVLLKDGFEGR